MKTNPHFSVKTLGFTCFTFSMNIIKWEDFLSSVFNLIKFNHWIPWQHGKDGSDYLGSLDPVVLFCQVTPSYWIFQEWVAQCSLLILITNTANAYCCIPGILKRWLRNSKRRCSTKGLAWPTFMVTLQQSKLRCIYLSTATWKCGTLESVSWATYSIPSFPVSWWFLFYLIFSTNKTDSWFQCHFGKWIFEGLVKNVWRRNSFYWCWEQNTVEFIAEKIYSLNVANLGCVCFVLSRVALSTCIFQSVDVRY